MTNLQDIKDLVATEELPEYHEGLFDTPIGIEKQFKDAIGNQENPIVVYYHKRFSPSHGRICSAVLDKTGTILELEGNGLEDIGKPLTPEEFKYLEQEHAKL